ncbi:MAG: TonB-dependent receptor [Desulfobulbus sp.]|jgi:iron complex outermembrane receptor protein|nr:TonB-dependent receptor [Desulfobulbus sp.]
MKGQARTTARALCVGIALCASRLFVPTTGQAAQGLNTEEIKLDEMVVAATRDVKMLDTPASISVITARDLEIMDVKNIGDALIRVPGVFDDGASKYYLSIRGTRSSSSGGPLVLLDGVPQDLGKSGYNNYETIPVANIERIEILRSPGTTVFGADSARGVINIITKSGKKDHPAGGEISVSYGSWNTANTTATVSGGHEAWDYFANGSFINTDGYLHDEQTRGNLILKGGYSLDSYSRLGLNLGYTDNTYETVRGKNRWALDQDRRANEYQEKPDGPLRSFNDAEQKSSNVALDYRRKTSDGFINGLAAYTHFDEFYNARYQIYSNPNNVYSEDRDQDRYTMNLSGGLHLGSGYLRYTPTLGGDMELTTFDNTRTYLLNPTSPSHITGKGSADMDFDQKKYGLLFQNQFLFGEHVELNLGARRDDVRYKVANNNDERVNVSHEKYPWSVAPVYHWNDKATSYFTIGTSYWYPAPMYYEAAMSNMNVENLPENLEPEESLTYEIGHKHSFAKWANLNASLFYMKYKDKFALFYDSSQAYAGYKNTGDSEHKGIELELDGRVSDLWGYRLSGTYMEAEWTSGRERVYTWETDTSRDFRDLDGYQLSHVPKYKYTMGVDIFPIEHLRFNVDLNVTGSYYVDYLNRIEYDSRQTVDMGVRYELKDWSIWFLAKNLFKEDIESVYNSSGELNSSAEDIALNGLFANEYNPRQGQSFEIGLSYRF